MDQIAQGLWNAFQMAWEVWWALVLGFLLSGIVQAWVPRARMERALGGRGLRSLALATGFGPSFPNRDGTPGNPPATNR